MNPTNKQHLPAESSLNFQKRARAINEKHHIVFAPLCGQRLTGISNNHTTTLPTIVKIGKVAAIARDADFERHPLLQIVEVRRRDHVETDEVSIGR